LKKGLGDKKILNLVSLGTKCKMLSQYSEGEIETKLNNEISRDGRAFNSVKNGKSRTQGRMGKQFEKIMSEQTRKETWERVGDEAQGVHESMYGCTEHCSTGLHPGYVRRMQGNAARNMPWTPSSMGPSCSRDHIKRIHQPTSKPHTKRQHSAENPVLQRFYIAKGAFSRWSCICRAELIGARRLRYVFSDLSWTQQTPQLIPEINVKGTRGPNVT
jgi:hypothetical protein